LTENQGIPQQVVCENQILMSLLTEPLGAEQLVKKLNFSKATIYKYLKELFNDNLIEYVNPKKQFGEIRHPYRLTEKGEKQAKDEAYFLNLRLVSRPVLDNFILTAKIKAAEIWISHLALPDKESQPMDDVPLLLELSHPDKRQQARLIIDLIESELTRIGYSIEKVYKLWLIAEGRNIAEILLCWGSKEFFKKLPFKAEGQEYSEFEKKRLLKHIQEGFNYYETGYSLPPEEMEEIKRMVDEDRKKVAKK
jgi:DNA-binding PadR family transcriptional regulator